MKRTSWLRAAILLAGAMLVGSGCAESDGAGSGDGQQRCVQGQVGICGCPDGSTGTVQCTEQGVAGECTCESALTAGMSADGAAGAAGIGDGWVPVAGASGMMVPAGAGGMMASAGTGAGTGATAGAGGESGAMATVGGAGGEAGTMPMGGVGGEAGAGTGAGGMTAGAGGMTAGAGGMTGGEEVPAGAACAAADGWNPAWTAFEDEVLRLTNQARAAGANCGAQGSFRPASPLTMNPILRCASRLHSMDMGERGYFAHNSQDGRSPFDRMAAVGYVGRTMGENIAKGQQSPQEVVAGWLDSDGHCANIMNPGFTEIGVGYWEGPASNQWFNGNKLWTQNFGAPRAAGR